MNELLQGVRDYDQRAAGYALDLPPLALKEFSEVGLTLDHTALPGESRLASGIGPADTLLQLPLGDGVDMPSSGVLGIYDDKGRWEHVDIVGTGGDQLQVLRRKGALDWQAGASLIVWDLVTVQAVALIAGQPDTLLGAATFPGGRPVARPVAAPACGLRFGWAMQASSAIQPGDVRWIVKTRMPMRSDLRAWSQRVEPTALVPEHHSVAYDGETVQFGNTGGGTSTTLTSHTSAGTNRCAVVGYTVGSGTPTVSATYGGTTMGAATINIGAGFPQCGMFTRVAPPTAGTNAVVTWSAASDSGAGVVSYNGVDQTTPFSATNSASGTSTTPTVTVTSTSDGMVVGIESSGWATSAVGAGQTTRWSDNVFGYRLGWMSDEAGTGGTVTHSYTVTGSDPWVIVCGNLQAVVVAASLPARFYAVRQAVNRASTY